MVKTNMSITINYCPICGYKEFTPFDSKGYPTYDICPCCSFEAGNEYDHRSSSDDFERLRNIWVQDMKAEWWKKPAPKNWDYKKQISEMNKK